MRSHRLKGADVAVDCPAARCRICELTDPAHPDFDARFLGLYDPPCDAPEREESTPVESSPVPDPSPIPVAESLARIKAMRACPHWRASSDCGCGNNRCAAGRGAAGVVSHRDCFDCLDASRMGPAG